MITEGYKLHFDFIITIDPGKNGGICVKDQNGLAVFKMPETFVLFHQTMTQLVCKKGMTCICIIEKVNPYPGDFANPGRAMQLQKLFNMYNKIIAFFDVVNIPVIPVMPTTWQRALSLKLPAAEAKKEEYADRKRRFKEAAVRNYPGQKVTLWNCDAMHLLAYTIRMMENDHMWFANKLKNKTDSF